MGNISGEYTNFKSAEFIYSRIKRQWKSFDSVNLLDDADFPQWTADVLRTLGISAYKEEKAVLRIKNNKAHLPKDFMRLDAAYKCHCTNMDIIPSKHFQYKNVIENDITCETLSRTTGCEVECNNEKIIERVTIKQYINDVCDQYEYKVGHLLKLSPNVRQYCTEDCINFRQTTGDEITINNNCINTNFNDGDIFIQYYAFPQDADGQPMIPDIHWVEQAIEWYIKMQIMLNFWFSDDVANVQNKWQEAEHKYEKAMAEARYILKLPSFATLVNYARNVRSINKLAFFANNIR